MAQVVERRLPAIYDALDSRNNKLALKLINSALQKQPKSQMLRTLKAIALQRTGKDEEGLQLCEEVRREVPTDEQLLGTMTVFYRRANLLQNMSTAFAAACAAHPRDEGLLRGMFTCYVRDFDFAGQQQVALKLHKLAGASDEFYVWWAIVATALQAKAAIKGRPSALPAAKLLHLAEVMVAKQAQRGGIQTYEQLMLYIDILQAQGKHKQALETVEGKLGDVMSMAADRRSLRASLHIALGQMPQAAALFREALMDNPDDWTSLQQYLDCTMTISSGDHGSDARDSAEGSGDQTHGAGTQDDLSNGLSDLSLHNQQQTAFQSAEDTVHELLDKIDTDPQMQADAARGVIRGPQLALVELQMRKLVLTGERTEGSKQADHGLQGSQHGGQQDQDERQDGKKLEGDITRALAEAVLSCYKQLGHMLSCAVDLRSYSRRVEGPSREWLAKQLQIELQNLTTEPRKQQQQLQGQGQNGAAESSPDVTALLQLRRQISAYQIIHDLGLTHGTAAAAEAHTLELFTLYKPSLTLCQGLDPKEKAPGDDLIPLAVASLMAARNPDMVGGLDSESGGKTGTEQQKLMQRRILQALLVCEAAQKRSSVYAATRFACCALYGLLGAAGPAATNFDALAIKHIQHDSITGHHMLPVALGCQDAPTLDRLLSETILLHEDHDRDAGDTLIMAFDRGTFTKIIEFVDFKERLERSHALAVARSEQSLIQIRRSVPRGHTDVQSALKDACHSLKATSLLTQHSGLPRLEQLRFNEDLSTRPAWLPPQRGPAMGSLLGWWEQQAHTANTGYGRCWWAQPSAAELPSPDAQALRQDRCRHLQICCLMPQAMLELTSFEPESAQADAGTQKPDSGHAKLHANGKEQQQAEPALALPQLSALMGVPYSDLGPWLDSVSASSPQLPQQWPVGQEDHSHSQLQAQQLISLAAFAAADAGKAYWQQCHQSKGGSSSDSHQAQASIFTRRLAAVQTVFTASCQQAARQLQADPGHMLLGSTVLAVVHLVSEPATWLSLCVLAWQQLFGGVKRKLGKKGKAEVAAGDAAPDGGHFGEQQIRDQLGQMQQAMMQSLQGVIDAVSVRLKAPSKPQMAHATQTALGDGQQDLAKALSGCLSQSDIHASLNAVLAAQCMTLKRIKLQASELISAM
ncbi:TPA: hypothetical protein ACH3X2_012800 [Trebouxia sp. C0005]